MAAPGPQATRLQPGCHRWCSCDRPLAICPTERDCPGIDFTLDRARTIGLCRCGRTQTPPECDGSHAADRPSLLKRLLRHLDR